MPLTINAAGLAIIQASEGLYLVAVQDPGGIWTIGYGHTVGVTAGQQVTQAQADALLAQDLAIFETGVSAVAAGPSSNEFSAMVSLAFNIGLGAFNGSTVLRESNAGNKAGAADAFLLWNKAHVDGQLVELPGLDIRRQKERALYLTPDAAPAPLPPAPTDTYTGTLTDAGGNSLKVTVTLAGMSAAVALVAMMATEPAPQPIPKATEPIVRPDNMPSPINRIFDFSGSTFRFDRSDDGQMIIVPLGTGR